MNIKKTILNKKQEMLLSEYTDVLERVEDMLNSLPRNEGVVIAKAKLNDSCMWVHMACEGLFNE